LRPSSACGPPKASPSCASIAAIWTVFATTVGMEGLAALMAAVADRIAAILPRQASFCRYGDEEFLLWCPGSPTPMPWRPSPGSW
jgi:hypothetical protein